jgi:hypothetical protein
MMCVDANQVDANVFLVDWGKGAHHNNYFQVASDIRVVAAELTRLSIKNFIVDFDLTNET